MGFCLFVSFSYCFCFCCSFVIKTAILNSEHSRRINKGTLERCHRNTESSTEILILHAKNTSSKDLPLVEFMYLEVTRMPSSSGESVAQSWSTCSRTPKLTPSLPQHHLKTTNKNVKFETIELSVFFFSSFFFFFFFFLFFLFLFFLHWHVKGFSSKRLALKVDVIGPENVLFACASVKLSTRKFYRLRQ